MSGVEGCRTGLGDLGLVLDGRSAAPHDSIADETEARLLREMRAICALHDLYDQIVGQPVPQHLADLVTSYEPLRE